MGRSGKVATPRICSTFELRTSSYAAQAMALITLLPPPSSTPPDADDAADDDDALSNNNNNKPLLLCSSPPPPSPDTPGQTPPASVKPQVWPQDVLALMQQQVKILMRSSYGGGGGDDHDAVKEAGKRKRDCADDDDEDVDEEAAAAAAAVAGGIEVELHTQSPLPEDWEQFLDLKTGELYYFHWCSCKRAKKDPRELIREVDESVRALVLKAQARFTPPPPPPPKIEFPLQPDTTAVAAAATTTTTTTDVAANSPPQAKITSSSDIFFPPSQASLSPGEVESVHRSEEKMVKSKCADEEEEEVEEEEETSSSSSSGRETRTATKRGMVALGCRHCSMFVMLSLSFPSCPSCGQQSLHADHDSDG